LISNKKKKRKYKKIELDAISFLTCIVSGQKSYVVMKLSEVIFEALSRHAAGISFRERNAGPQLDNKMQSKVVFKFNRYIPSIDLVSLSILS
jgi:hypothetical protein